MLKRLFFIFLLFSLSICVAEEKEDLWTKKIQSLDIKDTDIREVLKIISDISGWSIITSAEVKGKVSLWLKDITVSEALEKVLEINGYVYEREDNIITVMKEETYRKKYGIHRSVFPLRFARAAELVEVIKPLTTEIGKVLADPRTNKLIIVDTRENLEKLEEIIPQLDDETITITIPLKYADPVEIKANLEKVILTPGVLEVDKRNNQLIVTGTKNNIERIISVVEKLDHKVETHVYQPLDIKDKDIQEVLKIISDISGWSIITSAEVKGKVSLWLKDITIGEALEKVLEINGYAYEKKGDVVTVMKQEEYEKRYGIEKGVFSLQYASAHDLIEVVQSLTTQVGKVIADAQTNKIIVMDTPESLQEIAKIIPQLDKEAVTMSISLKYADAEEIKASLKEIISPQGVIEVSKQNNQIILSNIPANTMSQINKLIQDLDQEIEKRVFLLENARASEVIGSIEPLLTKSGKVIADVRINKLIVMDRTTNLNRIANIIGELDGEMVTMGFSLKYADVTEVKASLEKILGPGPSVEVDKRSNYIIITGIPRCDALKVRTLTQQMDQEMEIEVITLDYADAEKIKPALEKMLSAAGGLEINKRSNQIILTDTKSNLERILKVAENLDQELETQVYQLNYAEPVEVETKLGKIIPPEEGEFYVDKRTRVVSFAATPSKASQIFELLKSWDKKTKQVWLEAKLIEINRSTGSELGINWSSLESLSIGASGLKGEYSRTKGKEDKSSRSITRTVEKTDDEKTIKKTIKESDEKVTAFSTSDIISDIRTAVLSASDFRLILSALQSKGNVELISNPKIVTTENQEARIVVGSNVPIPIYEWNKDTGTWEISGYQDEKIGITLVVTPSVNEDKYITLKVHTQVGEIIGYTGPNNERPITSVSEAETHVVIKDGETLTIGGLIKNKEDEAIKKVPLLGNIPVLGWFFKHKSKVISKVDLVIFITAHILREEGAQEVSALITETKGGRDVEKIF